LTLTLALALGLTGVAHATPPTADFTSSPAVVRVGAPVSFAATAAATTTGATVSSIAWRFDDGTTTSGAAVQHTYSRTGPKVITLTVTDSNGEFTSVPHSVSVIGPPTAAFVFSPAVPNIAAAITFDGSGSSDSGGSIQGYAWDFGDGSSAIGGTATHAYASGGDKTVTLTVTSAQGGATASVSHTVHVNVPPVAALDWAAVAPGAGQDPKTPLLNQQVTFSGRGSGDSDGSIATYEWDLGTGTFGAPSAVPDVTTGFAKPGRATVRLRVTDSNGATDIATVTFRVNSPPVAAFTFAPRAPLIRDVVVFTSTASDPDGSGDIHSIQWDLNGDGTYSDATGPRAQVTFQNPGDYTIRQKVTDAGGASTIATQTVSVKRPAAAVNPPASQGPPPAAVPFSGAPVSGAETPGTAPKTALRAFAGVRLQIAGSVAGRRTSITQLLVVGPGGASVRANCKGRGCPRREVRSRMPASGRLRLKRLERTLQAGAHIVVTIAKPGFVTKQIVLNIRQGKAPSRTERCVIPGSRQRKTGPCPA
jgi:PKD repeat protein